MTIVEVVPVYLASPTDALAFLCNRLAVIEKEGEDVLANHMSRIQDTFGIKFEEGYNPKLKFMSHLWEPMRVHLRPLAFYLFTELIAAVAHFILLLMGFRHRQHRCIGYWIRNAPCGIWLTFSLDDSTFTPPMLKILQWIDRAE
eukprot:scaffold83626_cov35-Prasinocladus_malaysianus.AAC.1